MGAAAHHSRMRSLSRTSDMNRAGSGLLRRGQPIDDGENPTSDRNQPAEHRFDDACFREKAMAGEKPRHSRIQPVTTTPAVQHVDAVSVTSEQFAFEPCKSEPQ